MLILPKYIDHDLSYGNEVTTVFNSGFCQIIDLEHYGLGTEVRMDLFKSHLFNTIGWRHHFYRIDMEPRQFGDETTVIINMNLKSFTTTISMRIIQDDK